MVLAPLPSTDILSACRAGRPGIICSRHAPRDRPVRLPGEILPRARRGGRPSSMRGGSPAIAATWSSTPKASSLHNAFIPGWR